MTDPESLVPRVIERVKELRRARKWSCRHLALEMAHRGYDTLTRSTLTNLENGRRDSVSIDELVAFGAVFGVEPWSLTQPDARCPRCWDSPPAGFTCTSCGNTGQDDLPREREVIV